MRVSNSKLTEVQKNLRKYLIKKMQEVGGYFVVSRDNRVTLAIWPKFKGSNMVSVGVSIMSYDEKRYRREVGEFYAINRVYDDWCFPAYAVTDFEALANILSLNNSY